MKTYTAEQVERIVKLRTLRIQMLRGDVKYSPSRMRSISGELYQLTNNSIYR
jgi:hypothetical protein